MDDLKSQTSFVRVAGRSRLTRARRNDDREERSGYPDKSLATRRPCKTLRVNYAVTKNGTTREASQCKSTSTFIQYAMEIQSHKV